MKKIRLTESQLQKAIVLTARKMIKEEADMSYVNQIFDEEPMPNFKKYVHPFSITVSFKNGNAIGVQCQEFSEDYGVPKEQPDFQITKMYAYVVMQNYDFDAEKYFKFPEVVWEGNWEKNEGLLNYLLSKGEEMDAEAEEIYEKAEHEADRYIDCFVR